MFGCFFGGADFAQSHAFKSTENGIEKRRSGEFLGGR